MKEEAKMYALKWKDAAKGFLIATLTVILTGAMTGLTSVPPHFPTMQELQVLAVSGLGAGLAYIIKNYFSNSDGQFMKKEVSTEQPK